MRGNVRELESSTKRAVITTAGMQVTAADLGLDERIENDVPSLLREARHEAERRAVVSALGRVNGNIAKAAELLGISRAHAIRHYVSLRT